MVGWPLWACAAGWHCQISWSVTGVLVVRSTIRGNIWCWVVRGNRTPLLPPVALVTGMVYVLFPCVFACCSAFFLQIVFRFHFSFSLFFFVFCFLHVNRSVQKGDAQDTCVRITRSIALARFCCCPSVRPQLPVQYRILYLPFFSYFFLILSIFLFYLHYFYHGWSFSLGRIDYTGETINTRH